MKPGDDLMAGLVVAGLALGGLNLWRNGLPSWWPDPVNTALLLGLAACGLFLIVARRWR